MFIFNPCILQHSCQLLMLYTHMISSDDTVCCYTGQLVPENCSDYDVRLVEGNGYMGRVEACYSRGGNSSLWGPICKWDATTWGVGHAVTVCSQLNFPTAASKEIHF